MAEDDDGEEPVLTLAEAMAREEAAEAEAAVASLNDRRCLCGHFGISRCLLLEATNPCAQAATSGSRASTMPPVQRTTCTTRLVSRAGRNRPRPIDRSESLV